MGSFGWQSPWPRRFGGGAHAPVATMLATVRAARPDALTSTEDGSEADLENKALARALVIGLHDNARRVAQRDPRSLSLVPRLVTYPDGTQAERSPLVRWERILGLTPARRAGPTARRAAVHAAIAATASAKRGSVETAMAGIFGDWYVGLQEPDLADVDYPGRATPGDVHAFWPVASSGPDTFHDAEYPGEYSTTIPWASAMARVVVLIAPPAAVSQDDIKTRTGKAVQVLDDMLPAWMSFAVSQLPAGTTTPGFFVGVSYLGLTAL